MQDGKITTLPNQHQMLYVFSHINSDTELVPCTPHGTSNDRKRTHCDLEEMVDAAPLSKRSHSESVDMAMYMNRGGSAAHMMDRRISMEAVTEKAERCLPEEIIDAALMLLRSDLEIRQQFMSFRNDDAARRNIMYELSNR